MEENDKAKKGVTSFGDGFMEKATKHIEEEKALSKVTSKEVPAAKRCYNQDPNNLCRFLEKGTPAWYSGRKHQHQHLYSQHHNSKQGQDPKQQARSFKTKQYQ